MSNSANATASENSPTTTRLLRYVRYVRLLVMLLNMIAMIVMGFNTQKLHVANTWISFKTTNSSAFFYFVLVNGLVYVYSFFSTGLSFKNNLGNGLGLSLAIGDVMALILLSTGNAAAAAIEVVAWKGNSHFGWDKFCNFTTYFCHRALAAIIISSLTTAIYFLLLVLSLVIAHNKTRN